uniref:Zinc finger PHD-type domain-containing protein n=1 Tax=Cacopsylla melanoneura TaxID=428564 RepID=A0A8D9EIV5_9HEMI
MSCSKCNTQVKRKEESISCLKCNKIFHLGSCTDLGPSPQTADMKKWLCTSCTTNPPRTKTDSTDKKSLDDIDSKLNQLLNHQKETTTKIDKLIVDNENLKKMLTEKDQVIFKLEKRVLALEQRTRINNIEIANYPESPNENAREVFKKICAVLELDVADSDIQASHRVPRFNPTATKNIVVNFSSRWVKNKVLIAIKKFKKDKKRQIKASDVSNNLPAENVYVSEHLCPAMKQLLKKTKDYAKTNQYQYVWVKDGVIHMKKNDVATNVVVVGSEHDIPQRP